MSDSMTIAVGRLRLIQADCIIMVVGCILVAHFVAPGSSRPASGFWQVVVVVSAIWSAVSGFTMQRKLL